MGLFLPERGGGAKPNILIYLINYGNILGMGLHHYHFFKGDDRVWHADITLVEAGEIREGFPGDDPADPNNIRQAAGFAFEGEREKDWDYVEIDGGERDGGATVTKEEYDASGAEAEFNDIGELQKQFNKRPMQRLKRFIRRFRF